MMEMLARMQSELGFQFDVETMSRTGLEVIFRDTEDWSDSLWNSELGARRSDSDRRNGVEGWELRR